MSTIDVFDSTPVTYGSVSGVGTVIFHAAATVTFDIDGSGSSLPADLGIELDAGVTSPSIVVAWAADTPATIDFSSWSVTGANTVNLQIDTQPGVHNDRVVLPYAEDIAAFTAAFATTVDTGDGDDTVVAGTGHGIFHGGDGKDVLSFELDTISIQIDASGSVVRGNDVDSSFDGFEILRGGTQHDVFSDGSEIGGAIFQGLGGGDYFSGTETDEVDYSGDTDLGGTSGIVLNRSGEVLDETTFTGLAGTTLLSLLNGVTSLGVGEVRDTFGDIDVVWNNLIISGSAMSDFMVGGGDNETFLGNGGDDWLFGGLGDDVLGGGSGTNSLVGGGGDDTYLVDSNLDIVDEGGGSGQDLVKSSVSFSLVAGAKLIGVVEDLVLTGMAITATGNASVNHLTGNALANVLDGGAAADIMKGMAGGDTYVVDNTLDVVDETGGSDRTL